MPLKEHYQTVIVGSGPAGVMAARQAARSGSVLMVEAMGLPRTKSCGGMLNEYSQAYLESIGSIPQDLFCDPEWINFRFFDWDRDIRKGTTLRFANIDRKRFDDWLVQMLPDSVDISDRTKLTALAQTEDGVTAALLLEDGTETTVSCDYLIGCDGPRSTTRRCLPVSQLSLYKTLQEFIPIEGELEPYFDCIYSRHIGSDYGYGYIIPKDDYAILGSVFFPGSKGCKELHEKAMVEFGKYYPFKKESFHREAWTAVKVTTTADIVGGYGRVLLAGEAGGIMSPSSGEGISFAMNSGNLAGAAVADALAQAKRKSMPKVIHITPKAVATTEAPAEDIPAENIEYAPSEALKAYRASLKPIKGNIAKRLRYFPVLNSNWGKWLGGSSPLFLVDKVAHRI